jgi:hypothetical protein
MRFRITHLLLAMGSFAIVLTTYRLIRPEDLPAMAGIIFWAVMGWFIYGLRNQA